jgi:hypothetical protein
MAERGIDRERHAWYRDLRRYGTMPHAGFALAPAFAGGTLAYYFRPLGISIVRDRVCSSTHLPLDLSYGDRHLIHRLT